LTNKIQVTKEDAPLLLNLWFFGVLKFPKVRYVQQTCEVVYQTTFRWHIYSAIFVPKIIGIGNCWN